jgi:hypothetical protein
MKILSEQELQKLPTKRLLALFKKIREIYRKRLSLLCEDEKYNDETIEIMFYKDEIKKILDTREDTHGGEI